ncbi:MAG TPA: hypothetical protein VFT60_04680 [Bryobacteraceae bacterium]|nr:hypothetical protein [Bryobacteraceae bacterium]
MTFPRIMVRAGIVLSLLGLAAMAFAQVIEYESNGEKYQTLTHRGLTVILTHMPVQVAGYGLIQVSIANGSDIHWTVKPEQFAYARGSQTTQALSADDVVNVMLAHASGSDTIKLITSYEHALYSIPHMRGKNGYEERRQNALAFGGSTRLRAAAAAAAITLAQVRLAPGDSTDGAVFIRLARDQKKLTGGRVVLKSEGETFEFNPD